MAISTIINFTAVSFFCIGLAAGIAFTLTLRKVKHPCADLHEFIAIGAQSPDSQNTVALFRCVRCKVFTTVLFPGKWTLEDFLKTELGQFLEGLAK